MRNTVTLNGVSSSTITGLLIQELPPVIKPKIRTRQEIIDGRAGDIVTDLGFEAYDKEMLIGLYGNFNIDNVSAFFNSYGTAVFSNEPDKEYTYAIYESIDYERLARFRTATVKFHVQPFKYAVNETELDVAYTSAYSLVGGGNVPARPIITVYGSGDCTFYKDGVQILAFTIPNDDEYITLDFEDMNAYYGGVLKNRNVTGDMSAFYNPVNGCVISFDGNVTQLQISKYKRWI